MSEGEVRPLGFGIVGAGWMGHVHARAITRVRHHYPEIAFAPTVTAVADTLESHRRDFQSRHGPVTDYANWRELIADPDVNVVCVTAPNSVHRQIGVAVAEAGKHLWIEKPVGLGSSDVDAVRAAVDSAGVRAVVGFNYRNFPAVERARELIRTGAIGTPTNAHVRTLADYAADPRVVLSWRFSIGQGGHGVLADLASHGFDLIRFLLGDIDTLVASTATFIDRRPLAVPGASHFDVVDIDDPTVEFGTVENEDYLNALVRTAGGALVTYEASRTSVGDQCTYGFTVHGQRGHVSWDFRRSDELVVAAADSYQDVGTQRFFGTPGYGEYTRFQPGAGNAMGYDDSKVIELARLLGAIATGVDEGATLADALGAARANEAAIESARTGAWVSVAG